MKKTPFSFYPVFYFFVMLAFFTSAQKKEVKLDLKQLQGNVYFLEGGLGNVTIQINGSEMLMVDTKSKDAGEAIEEFLKTQLKGKTLKYIVNTHMHFDHTGNNERLGKGVTIIAHQNSRKVLEADSEKVHVGWPNLTFDKEMNLYFGDEEIRLIYFPSSHTNHDLVVYFTRSKVLSMGDMYFSGMYPFIDDTGNLSSLITNLDKIIKMMPPDVKIVPGHGPVSTLEDLKATHAMLVGTSEYIKKQIDAGKTLEAIKKEGLPAWTLTWGKGYCKEDCWVETVYGYLSK